jgi:hypothetical protein
MQHGDALELSSEIVPQTVGFLNGPIEWEMSFRFLG